MRISSLIWFVAISFPLRLLLHGGAGETNDWELIVWALVALLTGYGAMHLNRTWFHLFRLHLARGPWRDMRQFISSQTKEPLRLLSPQPDVHIIRYPQPGSDLIKHQVCVSCQLLTGVSWAGQKSVYIGDFRCTQVYMEIIADIRLISILTPWVATWKRLCHLGNPISNSSKNFHR